MDKFEVGTEVVCNGHQGTVIELGAHNGIVVRFMGGNSVEVDASDVQPGYVWEHMVKAAQSDMRKARKEGSILIAQTRRGTVELTYIKGERAFELHAEGRCIGRALSSSANAVAMLAPLYQVECG